MPMPAFDEPQRRLRLYAQREENEVRDLFLIRQGNVLALFEESSQTGAVIVPPSVLSATFARYGRPLEEGLNIAEYLVEGDEDDAPLAIPLLDGSAAQLRRFRYMPFGWVYAADYLLWEAPAAEPLAAPAPLVTSALFAVCRALQKK